MNMMMMMMMMIYWRFVKYPLLLYLELTHVDYSRRVPESNLGCNAFTRNEASRHFTEFL
jgi:hypothetical protein